MERNSSGDRFCLSKIIKVHSFHNEMAHLPDHRPLNFKQRLFPVKWSLVLAMCYFIFSFVTSTDVPSSLNILICLMVPSEL